MSDRHNSNLKELFAGIDWGKIGLVVMGLAFVLSVINVTAFSAKTNEVEALQHENVVLRQHLDDEFVQVKRTSREMYEEAKVAAQSIDDTMSQIIDPGVRSHAVINAYCEQLIEWAPLVVIDDPGADYYYPSEATDLVPDNPYEPLLETVERIYRQAVTEEASVHSISESVYTPFPEVFSSCLVY